MLRFAVRVGLKREQHAVLNSDYIWHNGQSISQSSERENPAREPPCSNFRRLRLLRLAAQERRDVQVVGGDFVSHVGDVACNLLHHVGLLRRDVAAGGLLA